MEDFMLKRFGASGINREMFEDCFEQPINLENVSDSEMQKLADEVESIVREKYPDVADTMFRLWKKEELTDEEIDYLAINIKETWDFYWDTLFRLAIKVVWDAPTIEQVVEVKYSLDPNREMPYMVIDRYDEVGMEGVYAGSYDDCQIYMAGQAKVSSCIGMEIVPNPHYQRR